MWVANLWLWKGGYLGMTVAEIARSEGADRRRVWESIRRGLKKLARLLDTAR